MSTNGYIYCIADEHRRIKLGYSQDVDTRLKQLQTGNSDKLTILYRLAVPDMRKAEKSLHALFTGKQIGEWFRISDAEHLLLKKIFRAVFITEKEHNQMKGLGLR